MAFSLDYRSLAGSRKKCPSLVEGFLYVK